MLAFHPYKEPSPDQEYIEWKEPKDTCHGGVAAISPGVFLFWWWMGWGGGEKKRRKGGGDTSFFMRDCH